MLPWLASSNFLWVSRSVENPFAAIVRLKMLIDIQKSMLFYENVFIYYFAIPKHYSIKNRFSFVTPTLRIVSKFTRITTVISHLKKYLCAYKKTFCDAWNQFETPILGKTQFCIKFCFTEECVYSWFSDLCVLHLDGFCNSTRKWWCF